MYNPSAAGTAGATPPPPAAPSASARYAYLVGRLRSRQITMEEATELFDLLQQALARSAAQTVARPAASTAPPARATAPVAAESARGMLGVTDDTIALSLLAFGAGAGVLAALLKRSTEGPKTAVPK